MQQAYINEFTDKSKVLSAGKNSVNNIEKKPGEPWWMHHAHPPSVERKKFVQHMEESQEISQRPKGSLNQQIFLQKLSPRTDEDQSQNMPLDIDAVKITTIIETIRRRVQRRDRTAEGTNDIRGTVTKIRSRRSLYESENHDSKATEGAKRDRNRRERFFPKKRVADTHDLKTASGTFIPSTVFYKRIWEYINGTRPHSDIISGLENNSNKTGNSSCTKKDPFAVSQSQKGELRVIDPTMKPERKLYEHIWDIINATSKNHQARHKNSRARSKRDVNTPISNTFAAASGRSCVQADEEADGEGDKQAPTTREEARLDTTQPRKEFASDPYTSGFWAVATKEALWQPEVAISAVNEKLSDPILPSQANAATEVADLNQFRSHSAENDTDDSSGENSTAGYVSEEILRDKPQDFTGPLYPLGRENSNSMSFSPNADMIDKASREDDRAGYVEHDDEADNPSYDPSSIPYVEVPDNSDQQRDTLNERNRSAHAVEYDDGEPGSSYRVDDSSSKSPDTEIQSLPSIPARSDGRENSSDANISRCTESQNSTECADKRDHPESDANSEAEPEASAEREDTAADYAPIDFDINEYRKPFDLDSFLKEDPIFGHGAASEAETRHEDDEENAGPDDDDTKESKKSDRDDESEESAESDRNDESRKYESTYPKAKWYDYFARNADFHDHSGAASQGNADEAEEQDGESHAKEGAESSGTITSGDYNPHDDGDFLRHIFGKDNSEEPQSDVADTEGEFLSRYFTEDVLRQLHENSTAAEEEDRKREESRNREDVHKTLSMILGKKDRFSRLDEGLDKMIEAGEAVPIKYNNYWSLEYESPGRKNNKEEGEKEKEEEEKENDEEA